MCRFGEGATDAIMVNNAEWLDGLNYIGFLRDIGRHFSVNRMLSFESVKSRLDREQSLSFLEFNYMILQAYDFLEIAPPLWLPVADGRVGPVGQHRQRRRPDAPGDRRGSVRPDLAALTTSDGRKMGKSAVGAVWLNGDMLFALRVLAILAQHDGCRCGPVPEALHRPAGGGMQPAGRAAGSEINAGQDRAGEPAVTTLLHGAEAAAAAEATAREVFEKGGIGEDLPTVTLAAEELAEGVGIVQLFVRAGLRPAARMPSG
jgi:tyrosyl-tRNA synthetase